MTPFCPAWLIALLPPAFQVSQDPKPNAPIAPSLPALSDADEERLDGIIDRFMLYDTGKLGGAAGSQALAAFQKLGNEAIPALLRGLRKSAELEHSCPVTVIAKKLRLLLGKSEDPELLAFARDEISAIDSIRYRGLLTDLRVGITRRQADLVRLGITPPKPASPLARLSVDELNRRISLERQEKVLAALGGELATRGEVKASDGLGHLAGSVYPAVQKEGLRLLSVWMEARSAGQAAELLKHGSAQVRLLAARRLLNLRDKRAVDALLLLKDPVARVREDLHGELKRIAGKDLASPGKTVEEQERAARIWMDWWKQREME